MRPTLLKPALAILTMLSLTACPEPLKKYEVDSVVMAYYDISEIEASRVSTMNIQGKDYYYVGIRAKTVSEQANLWDMQLFGLKDNGTFQQHRVRYNDNGYKAIEKLHFFDLQEYAQNRAALMDGIQKIGVYDSGNNDLSGDVHLVGLSPRQFIKSDFTPYNWEGTSRSAFFERYLAAPSEIKGLLVYPVDKALSEMQADDYSLICGKNFRDGFCHFFIAREAVSGDKVQFKLTKESGAVIEADIQLNNN